MVDDPSIEVIDLLTQPVIREEVVRAAIKAKKPVITEKPFAQTVEEAERMVAFAAEAGVPIAVHQNYRWMKMNFAAYHIIKKRAHRRAVLREHRSAGHAGRRPEGSSVLLDVRQFPHDPVEQPPCRSHALLDWSRREARVRPHGPDERAELPERQPPRLRA